MGRTQAREVVVGEPTPAGAIGPEGSFKPGIVWENFRPDSERQHLLPLSFPDQL